MSINKERILYEDEDLLAVNKLSGELTVKGARLRCASPRQAGKLSLLDFLKKDYPGLQTIHRLDFETSGVVVFAKNKKVASVVKDSKFGGWKKTYRTIVVGRPRERGEIRISLPARKIPNSKFQIPNKHQIPNSKIQNDLVSAVTIYKILKYLGDISYVECVIETGRHHQIRRHFAGIGHPLVLDEVYGDRKFNQRFTRGTGYRKFFLHAYSIECPHPISGKIMHIQAALPRAFEVILTCI